jgi:5-methylcytosine-specific restriction protein A
MPRAPKPCGIQGCTTIVPNGQRCVEHASGWKTSPRTTSSGRTSQRSWKQLRTQALSRDNHQCLIRGPRCTTHATQVDHITPTHLGGTDNLTNLQSTCHPCHTSKTAQEAREART